MKKVILVVFCLLLSQSVYAYDSEIDNLAGYKIYEGTHFWSEVCFKVYQDLYNAKNNGAKRIIYYKTENEKPYPVIYNQPVFYYIMQKEFYCPNKTWRDLEKEAYNPDGYKIDNLPVDLKWHSINSEAYGEIAYESACKYYFK